MSRPARSRSTRPLMRLVAAALLLGASAVSAKDLCIDDPSTPGNPDFIANKFKIPKPGTCRPFVGLYWPSLGYLDSALQGVACTPTAGDIANFTMTLGFPPNLSGIGSPGQVTYVTMVLALPGLQGRYTAFLWGSAHTEFGGVAVASKCDSKDLI